jgi:hypothetical protein
MGPGSAQTPARMSWTPDKLGSIHTISSTLRDSGTTPYAAPARVLRRGLCAFELQDIRPGVSAGADGKVRIESGEGAPVPGSRGNRRPLAGAASGVTTAGVRAAEPFRTPPRAIAAAAHPGRPARPRGHEAPDNPGQHDRGRVTPRRPTSARRPARSRDTPTSSNSFGGQVFREGNVDERDGDPHRRPSSGCGHAKIPSELHDRAAAQAQAEFSTPPRPLRMRCHDHD